jgi:hypothetical protein
LYLAIPTKLFRARLRRRAVHESARALGLVLRGRDCVLVGGAFALLVPLMLLWRWFPGKEGPFDAR